MNPYEDESTNMQGPPPPPPPPPGRPLNPSQKSAIAAALVGTAALGGAAYGLAQFITDEPEKPPVVHHSHPDPHLHPGPPNPPPPPFVPVVHHPDPPVPPDTEHEPRVSEHNFDKMTFPEAFHEAREEMGKGNYFEWHGHLYNTYHQEEWDKMTPGQHQDFLTSVYGEDSPEMHGGDAAGGHSGHGGHEGHGGGAVLAGGNGEIPPPPDVPPAIEDVNPGHTNAAVADATAADATAGHGTAGQPGAATADADITVEDSLPEHDSADHHAAHIADTGSVTVDEPGADGHVQLTSEPDVVVADLDGHAFSAVDFDHDGHADVLLGNDSRTAYFDTNHDHIMDTQATYDPTTGHFIDEHALTGSIAFDSGMDMDDLHHSEMQHDAHLSADSGLGPDFDNNFDITDYA